MPQKMDRVFTAKFLYKDIAIGVSHKDPHKHVDYVRLPLTVTLLGALLTLRAASFSARGMSNFEL